MPRRRGQGEGSVEELPSGKWRAVFTVGKKTNGSQDKISETFEKRSEATMWLEEQRGLRRMGATYAQSSILVKDWLSQWLRMVKCSLAPGSYAVYERACFRLDRHLGHYQLRHLTPLVVGKIPSCLQSDFFSPKTVLETVKVMKKCLADAVKMKMIYSNPFDVTPMPRGESKEMRCWTKEDVQKFLDSVAKHKHYALFLLALDTGMRRGELLALRWRDVSLLYGHVDVHHTLDESTGAPILKSPKTAKSRRRIYISKASKLALSNLLGSGRRMDSPVFSGRNDCFMWAKTVQRMFAKAVKKADVPKIRFHDLRHTNATLLLASGVGIKTVSERLGHTSVAITLGIYTHVLPGEQEAVAGKVNELLSHSHPTEAHKETKVQVNDFDTSDEWVGSCGLS